MACWRSRHWKVARYRGYGSSSPAQPPCPPELGRRGSPGRGYRSRARRCTRSADRQRSAMSDQLPPRITRMEPTERSHRIVRGRPRIIVFVIPILAPLPHVPVHIIQSPSAGSLTTYRVRHPVRIVAGTNRSRKAPVSSDSLGIPLRPELKLYRPVLPARHAYSHCASDGSRYHRPAAFSCGKSDSFRQNSTASSHDTFSTGNRFVS